MIKTLDEIVDLVLSSQKKHRLAVAWAQDHNTIEAVYDAVINGLAEAVLIGNKRDIIKTCQAESIDHSIFIITESKNEITASQEAVCMVKSGEADIVMKGLVSTDKFLKAVMDKENGIMKPGAVLSYVCALQIPSYHKLLIITDPAVIPFPDLDQKIAMAEYAIEMANIFGIDKPRVALIGASEKITRHSENAVHYAVMCKMAERGQIKNCIMDGPLDVFLACDQKSQGLKQVETPICGDADILLFPSLESCNPFYKGLMLFAEGELAGLLRGTSKPVVLMSRSEKKKSKYYCIALACLLAERNT